MWNCGILEVFGAPSHLVQAKVAANFPGAFGKVAKAVIHLWVGP